MDKIPHNSMESACKADLCAPFWRIDRLQERWQGFVWLLCLCFCGVFPALAAPSVTNVSFAQQTGLRLVSVNDDPSCGTRSASLLLSGNNGRPQTGP